MLFSSRLCPLLIAVAAGALPAAAHASTTMPPSPPVIDGSLTVDDGVAAYRVTNRGTSTRITSIDFVSPEAIKQVTASQGECVAEGRQAYCKVDLPAGQSMTIYGHSATPYAVGVLHELCAQALEAEGQACLKLLAQPGHTEGPRPTEPPPTGPAVEQPRPTAPPADEPRPTAPVENPKPVEAPKANDPVDPLVGVGTDVPGTDCHCVDLFARITRTDPVGSNSRGRGVIGFDVKWRMRCSGGAKFRTCQGKLKFSLPGYPNATITIAPYVRKRVNKPVYRTKNGIRQKDAQGHFIIDHWKVVVEDVKGRATAGQDLACATTCGGTVTGKSFVRVVIPKLGPADADGGRAIKVKVGRDCPGTPLADQDLELVFNSWGDLQKKKSTLS